MSWWAVDATADPASRDQVATWLVARTGQSVLEQADGTIVGFAADEPGARALEAELTSRFGPAVTACMRGMPEADWTDRWRDGIQVRRIGRLSVAPSWLPLPPDAVVVVRVDPETAFGTGEHGSTRSALALLEQFIRPGDLVLDLGSGSGIVAIAAVALGARQAVGVELDAEAIPVAMANAEKNGVAKAVRFLEGDAADLTSLLAPADLIVSNILRGPNTALLPVVRAALKPGGTAVFAGMELAEAPLFRPELERAGFTVVAENEDDGWWAVAGVVP
jgi:ribosomal protein L11 methyltransferase